MATSTRGPQTRFTVLSAPHMIGLAAACATVCLGPMRLFLCDDNSEYRMLARLVLEEAAHEIVGEAGDGVEAEERAPATSPDVILLDLNMPRRNGYEALPRLRELLPDSKIVVLTTGRASDERGRALTAGADGFIVKPDSVFDLADELHRALEAPRRTDA